MPFQPRHTVNLPDYVDSFAGVTQGFTGNQIGASNNADTFVTLVVQ